MFTPRNEPGVFYLFARFHEKLGFEEIVDVSTIAPDVIAKRNGKQVRIELEYKSCSAISHYRVVNEDPGEGKWTKEGNDWIFVLRNGIRKYIITDPHDEYRLDKDRNLLLRNTAKEIFDIIVCWKKDEVFEKNIEVIELQETALQ
jgi:hypothetical protein